MSMSLYEKRRFVLKDDWWKGYRIRKTEIGTDRNHGKRRSTQSFLLTSTGLNWENL